MTAACWRGWSRYNLNAIDEVRYVPLAEAEAEFLFQELAKFTPGLGSTPTSATKPTPRSQFHTYYRNEQFIAL